ncbi:autotransporter-associated beta strand repeat-containing protein [Luteolibacter sp. LG18]|uniref:autotransporter-associated beta strand repeat-containing protein n=1 Tax=Luteolibacter sp. LG18 TaxID=2819286 RepID=UPI0030C6A780
MRRAAFATFVATGMMSPLPAQTVDTVVFGNSTSESAHGLTLGWGPVTPSSWVAQAGGIDPSDPSSDDPSDVITGALGQTARRFLPRTPYADIYGGEGSLSMAVDPVKQNYLTVKIWGSDPNPQHYFILNVEDYEVGLRHSGGSAAPDQFIADGVSWAANQFLYRTVPLPLHLTQGKTSVALKLRSTGWLNDYDAGAYFSKYQKLMNSPSIGLYRLYSHVGSQLDVSGEAQTPAPAFVARTGDSEATTLATVKAGVNSTLSGYMGTAASGLIPNKILYMAQCYDAKENLGESWITYPSGKTATDLLNLIVDAIDYQVAKQSITGSQVAAFGNDSWGGGFAPLGATAKLLWPQLSAGAIMSTQVAYSGTYGTITRTSGWSKALRASVDYGRYNRRGESRTANQEIDVARNIYLANSGLLVVDPVNALYLTESTRYMREAAGVETYKGSDQTGSGPTPVRGTDQNWYITTSRGTTKDGGGFVASDYGEMGGNLFNVAFSAGDAALMAKALQVYRARCVFRYPNYDGSGALMMYGAEPIGDRNNDMPGHWAYLERGDGGLGVVSKGPSFTIGATNFDISDLLGYYQTSVADGQQLQMLASSYGPYSARNYTLVKAMAATNIPLPMHPGAPDFAWADEQNMVVAAKHGEERFFANLYWRSPDHINGFAKVFHLAGNTPRLAEVQMEDVRYKPSGTFRTLGPAVEGNSTRTPPDNPTNAYNGIVCPIPMRSDLTSISGGNPDAGRGTGYTLRYGHWLVGINGHYSATYDMILPSNFTSATDLISNTTKTGTVTLQPQTSVVFYLPDDVDVSARPARPVTLTAASSVNKVVLQWSPAAGATSYKIKRSTTPGGSYTLVTTVGAVGNYVDTPPASASPYYYVVCGVSAGGDGGDSIEASATLKTAGLLNRASGGTASASASASGYAASQAFDASTTTKWNNGVSGVSGWLQYDFGFAMTWAVTRYDITSADTTLRDPATWQFQGSNDGTTWTTLDSRSGETFATRALTKSYTFTNTTGYRYHRLNVTAVNGGIGYEMQVAELGLYASGEGTVPIPAVPTGLAATSGSRVFLSWNVSGGATSYRVNRATSSGGSYTQIGTCDRPYFQDSTAPASGTYYYTVNAVSTGGASAATSYVSAVYGTPVPSVPTGLTVASGPDSGQMSLAWNASTGVPVYSIYRSASGGAYVLAGTTTDTGYIDQGLTLGVTYTYYVTAGNSGGTSVGSSTASAVQSTYTWTGTTSANWNTATNWSGNLVPASGAQLSFGTATNVSLSNNITGLSVSAIAFKTGASAFTLAGNSLSLGGSIVDNAVNTQTISLPLVLTGPGTVVANVGTLVLSGVIGDGSGVYGVTKTGPGILALTGANTFDGGLTVSGGVVQLGTSTSSSASGSVTSLGAAGSTVTLNASTLRFQMGSNSNNTLGNNFVFNDGSLVLPSDGKITLGTSARTIAINGDVTLQSKWSGKWMQLAGVVTGSGTIVLNNANSNQVSAIDFTNGSNTYNGTIVLDDTVSGKAALSIGHNTALQYAAVDIQNVNAVNASVWFDTTAPVIGSLSGVEGAVVMLNTDGGVHGAGPVATNSSVTLTVGGDGSDTVYDGVLSGTGGLVKAGAGTFTLGGDNTFTGSTTVGAGTLSILGTHAGGIAVNSTAILTGDGSTAGTTTVNSGGHLAPGNAGAGAFTTAGLALNGGAILDFEIGNAATFDRIAIGGTGYTGPSSGTVSVKPSAIAGFGPGTYNLITGASGISAASFTLGSAAPSGYTYALSAASGTLTLTVTGPPSIPDGLTAYARSTSVSLVWNAATGATSYKIYRKTTGSYAQVGTSSTLSYTDGSLTNGTTYYYVVSGVNSYGESAQSTAVAAMPASNTWIAAPTSLNWSLAANWGGYAPVNNAALTFGSSSATNLTNDLSGLTLGGVTFNSGASAFTISGNAITLTGDIANNSTTAQVLNLDMTLVGTRTMTANTGAITLGGSLGDAGMNASIIKAGTGTLTLSNTNTYTGGTTVNAGTLVVTGSAPMGSGTVTLNGGTLQLGGATVYNTIVVPTGVTANLVKSSASTLAGNLTGGGTVIESGNVNSLVLSGDNTGFTGTFNSQNSGGTNRLKLATLNSGSASAAWIFNNTVSAGTATSFGNGTISFGSLAGAGGIRNDVGSSTATLRIGDLGTDSNFSGSISSSPGNVALTKVGAGSLTISGGIGLTGTTSINAGIYNVTGTSGGSGAVNIASGATLAGTGSVAGTVTAAAGSLVSPGNHNTAAATSAGTLTLTGAYKPAAGSILAIEVGATADCLTIDATGSYTAPASGTVLVNVSPIAGFASGTYPILTNAAGLVAGTFVLNSLPDTHIASLSVSGTTLYLTIRTPVATTWTGTTSGSLSLAANWGGTAPLEQDLFSFGTSANTALSNDLTGFTTRGLTFNSGASAYTLTGNALKLYGDITNNSTATQTLGLPLVLLKNTTVTSNTGAIAISGVISESGGSRAITKAGTGLLTLSGANTFSGGVTLSAGTLAVSGTGTSTAGALGTGTLTLAGGNLQHGSGCVLYNNIVAQAGTTTTIYEVSTGNNLDLYGSITGSGNLATSAAVNYGGTRLYGDNSNFTGTFTFNAGNAARNKFGSASAGSTQAKWVLNGTTDSPSFLFGTGTIQFGELSGSAGNVRQSGGGTTTVSAGALNTNSTWAGTFSNTGSIALTKVGTGVLTVSGTNTHTGGTTVNAGTLNLTGSLTGAGAVTVNAGGTLAGTGTITGAVTVASGGTIAPGNAGAGTLTCNGAATLNGGAVLAVEAGTVTDKLVIAGAYTGPASGTVTVNVTAGAGFTSGSYTLATATGISAAGFAIGTQPSGYACSLSAASGVLTLNVAAAAPPPSAIQTWRTAYLGSATASDTADADNDGRSNLLEYATGTRPDVTTSGAAAVLGKTTDGTRFTLTFTRIADSTLTYRVLAADSIADTWTTIWSSTGAQNTAGVVTVTDVQTIGTSPRRFLRLQVSY